MEPRRPRTQLKPGVRPLLSAHTHGLKRHAHPTAAEPQVTARRDFAPFRRGITASLHHRMCHDVTMPGTDSSHKLIRVPIGFPADLHEWLREQAFHRRSTMAELVRDAVQQYRERAQPQLGLPFDRAGGVER